MSGNHESVHTGHATPLRFGIIGTGHVARRAHIPAWSTLPGTTLAAVCDTDPEALEAALHRTQGGAVHGFPDSRELLALPLDAVSVCTHNAAHFPLALAALESGKHVLCEKPLCISAAEVRALGAAADACGLVLMARHPLRFTPEAHAAMEAMRAGAAGTIRQVRVRALRRNRIPTLPGMIDRALAGGGVAFDLGVHALDMALWLMDFPRATMVSGTVRTLYGHDENFVGHWGSWDRARFTVEDTSSGTVTFENGVTLSIECAWAGNHDPAAEGLSCTLYGDAGAVHWAAAETREHGASTQSSTSEFQAFADAIRSGGPSPVPWREALQSIAILEGLYRSAAENRAIALY
jgi:predicted dehydrogenase